MGNSVIIIGAGLAGLAAGCYARLNGYQSHIFEHHTVAGGVAAAWKRKGYLIDGGIHFLMGHQPGTILHDLYSEMGTAGAGSVVGMTTYIRFHDESSGRSLTVTKDLERLRDELKTFSPEDSGCIDELIDGARAMQGVDMGQLGIDKPPEITGFKDQLKLMWDMRRIFRYFSGKYNRSVSEYVRDIRDPWLREFLKNLFMPDAPLWFVLMILAILADGQLGLLKGGCPGFVLPIVKHYESLGGQVTYQATVEKVMVTNNRAVGVRLADGSEHRADAVISAADGYSTIFEMLDGHYLDDKINRRYDRWKLFPPILMVSYGVKLKFPDETPLSSIILEEPLQVGRHSTNNIMLRIFNYGDRFAPPGKTVVQVELETEWDYWHDLQRDNRAGYEAEKERLAAEILKRLGKYYPGISAQVEMTDVATPTPPGATPATAAALMKAG